MIKLLQQLPLKTLLLVAIIILSLFPRSLFLAETFHKLEFNYLLKGTDQYTFHKTALHISNRDDWLLKDQSYTQAPLYAYFLASLYKIFPDDVRTARVVQAILGIGISILIYLVGLRFFGPVVSFLSSLLYSFYDYSVFFESVLLRATLIGFLHLSLLVFLIKYLEAKKTSALVISGVILGLDIATRPSAVLLLPFAVFILWTIPGLHRTKDKLLICMIFLMTTVLPLVPFMSRNVLLGNPPLNISKQGLRVFVAGNMPDSLGVGWYLSPSGEELLQEARDQTGRVLAGVIRQAVLYPVSWVTVQARKAQALFNAYEVPNNVNLYLMTSFSKVLKSCPVNFHIIMVLFIPGLFLSLRNGRYRLPLHVFFLGIFCSIIIFYILARFRLPMVGMMCVFAGFTLEEIRRGFQDKKYIHLLILFPILILLAFSLRPSERTLMRTEDFYNMGLLYKQNSDLESAEVFYKKSLTIVPQNSRAARSLLRIYLQTGRTYEAENLARRQLSFHPDDMNILTLLGQTYIMAGKWVDADSVLKRLLSRFPDYAEAYYYLGVLRMKQEHYEEALELFRKTLSLDKRIQQAHSYIEYIKKKRLETGHAIKSQDPSALRQ